MLERSGDLDGARQALEKAAAVYHGPQPLWSLANFALRRGKEDLFWQSIRGSIERSPDEMASAASLCWRAYDDADEILAKAIPDNPAVSRKYIDFLLTRIQPAAIAGVWKRLTPYLQSADRPIAFSYLGQLVATEDREQAVAVWNDACRSGLIAFEPFTPSRRNLITNPDFSLSPSATGFDWRYAPGTGGRWKFHSDAQGTGRMELALSRDRPQQAQFLFQLVPVEPDTEYEFQSQYQSVELSDPTGMYWVAADRSGRPLGRSAPMAHAPTVAETGFRFRTGSDTHFVALRLAYKRVPGTTRRAGTFRLGRTSLEAAVGAASP